MLVLHLVKLLESKEVNHIEFCRIKNVLDEIMLMSRNAELSAILKQIAGTCFCGYWFES